MKVLMLCGVFAKENEQEVMRHAKAGVEFSANLFQQKLIGGFHEAGCDLQVISAPFIGSYPNASGILNFRGFSAPTELCSYVPFNNIWGIRNLSRAASLKKAVRSFIKEEDNQKLILVYCPHTPFLEAAVHAKKQDPRIRICLYVPDLPNYMNLSADRSRLYDIAKKYDIAVMTRLMEQVDAFVLLTAQMKDQLPVENKPCQVVEGIITKQDLEAAKSRSAPQPARDGLTRVVYTGKMNQRFGVKNLVEAFCMIPDPAYRLILCGRGDCEAYIAEKCRQDSRIQYLGQVTADGAKAWMRRADVLVNPRQNNEEYTKYSFPSKNIEYLLSGNPVVAYKLDGMPDIYRQFISIPADHRPESLAAAIITAATCPNPADRALEYLTGHCAAQQICAGILSMTGMD